MSTLRELVASLTNWKARSAGRFQQGSVLERERDVNSIGGPEAPFHSLTGEEALELLGSRASGLRQNEVSERRGLYGDNNVPGRNTASQVRILLRQLMSPLIYVLLAAGVLSATIGDLKDTVFIFLVVAANAAIGAFQEYKAERGAAGLQELVKTHTSVIREDRKSTIDSVELVPGDIIALEPGGRVPADARLLEVTHLSIDESVLTGESVFSVKNTGSVDLNTPLGDRVDMVFMGCMVMSGRGLGLVVATGLRTEFGKVADAVTATRSEKPPLVLRIESFARTISIAVLVVAVVLGVVSVVRGYSLYEAFFFATALAVAAIPEGLPAGITIALSVATRRMAKRHVIVRQLAAVEGLGSCTCIASDKTGTLTLNRQTVRLVHLPGSGRLAVSGQGRVGQGDVNGIADGGLNESQTTRLRDMAVVAAIDNEAGVSFDSGSRATHGDAVDVALLAFCSEVGLDLEAERRARAVVGRIPYEPERRYSATLHRNGGNLSVAAKGGLEAILPFCQKVQTEKGMVELDPASAQAEADTMALEGYRVIAIACGELYGDIGPVPFTEKDIPSLTLLGLIGLIDPVRPEAKKAVRECTTAGIKVVMVTGDHPDTALAIARELGIADLKEQVVTGAELAALKEDDIERFSARVGSARVFARVTPLEKVDIVQALMDMGHFVAVTGDGVNDAPALKKANIGVAMGSGTDVVKETASIIITDDNFASIAAGVEEGRYAYDNIRKVIWLLMSAGFAEVLLFVIVVFAGLPLALLPIQLLWLNLVTNGIQHVALALEPGEPGTMGRAARKPTEGVFNRLMLEEMVLSGLTIGLVAFGAWLYLLKSAGMGASGARNLVLLLMVLFLNVHVFNCRSETQSAFRVGITANLLLIAAVVVAQGVHILAMHVGFLQELLMISPVGFTNWLYLLALASTVLVTVEVYKALRARH